MERITQAAGYVSRTALPRGRARLAHLAMRYGPRHELTYRDQWGYTRVARLADLMEAYGFTGVPVLPRDVARRVAPGSWVVDAGANVGRVTAHLCHLVGLAGRVWAIEPLPHNVARLQRFKDQNGLDYLTIFEGGLSAVSGRASLRLPEGGESAYASFTKSRGMAGEIQVTTWRLDDLVYAADDGRDGKATPRDGRKVAFVKLDVEGFEPQVLAGAERTLREMKPLVFCEFNDILLRDAGSSSAELLRQFSALGYTPAHRLPPLDSQVVDILLEARG